LNAVIAKVDWEHDAHTYRVAGGHDLVSRDLTIVVHGKTYEIQAEILTKIPPTLQEVFDRLDVLYERITGRQ